MSSTISGFLELTVTTSGEVLMNLPPGAEVDEHGRSFYTFSPEQARNLAVVLMRMAEAAETGEDPEPLFDLAKMAVGEKIDGSEVLAIFPADAPLTRGDVVAYYGYTMERDIQAAMLPKPFRRIVLQGPDGQKRVVTCAS